MFYPIWNKDKIVYRLNDEILRVGSDDDDTQEIVGNIGFWEDLIKQIDGKKSVEELVGYLKTKYQIDPKKCYDFIEGFYKMHWVCE